MQIRTYSVIMYICKRGQSFVVLVFKNSFIFEKENIKIVSLLMTAYFWYTRYGGLKRPLK